ncbi:MAG: DsbA family protein [Microgenomates group bacterium]
MNKRSLGLIIFLLLLASFLGGSLAAQIKYGKETGKPVAQASPTQAPVPTQPPFAPKTKSAKPEVKFFVMSFCPYGNQAEAGLEPVYQLLKDKVTWTPQYIISDRKTSCEQSCPYRVYNDQAKSRCEAAVKNGQVKDVETCKGYFPYSSTEECLQKECAGLKAGEYESLHGPQELNQDIREIAAYNLSIESGSSVLGAKSGEGILSKWWKFISLVNEKCNPNNADTCWKDQAAAAGFDTAKISQAAKTKKIDFIKQEIAQTTKYQVSSSPTVYINDTLYNGGRSAEDYKKAICSAFENPPEECNQILGQQSATTSGGCN